MKRTTNDHHKNVASNLHENEIKMMEAGILYRLNGAKWHIDEVMKNYRTEPKGSLVDRLHRAQADRIFKRDFSAPLPVAARRLEPGGSAARGGAEALLQSS
jgi:hypothetical protein